MASLIDIALNASIEPLWIVHAYHLTLGDWATVQRIYIVRCLAGRQKILMYTKPFPMSLRDVLNETELSWLAGAQAFSQGQELSALSRVSFTDVGSTHVEAQVLDQVAFTVNIHLLGTGDLSYECNCPMGQMELFCTHCVASSLAWLTGTFDDDTRMGEIIPEQLAGPDGTDRFISQLRGSLMKMEREELIETIMFWAERDPRHACEILSNSLQF